MNKLSSIVCLTIITVILLATLPTVVLSEDFDFRNTRWSMSTDEVIQSEGKPPTAKRGTSIGYKDTLLSNEIFIVYMFTDGRLSNSKYSFTENHTNKNEYLSDFDTVEDALNEKYGSPVREKTYWTNDLYKDDYQEWGMAVSVGHLSKFTTWETPTTEIIHAIYGDNYRISHSIEYETKNEELKALKERAKKKETRSKL